ncbi:MAG: hypothetical protein H6711_31310 [Myxococcales bacterium]|nr:hypothetical protein [Myxococcales bacterium]
MTLDPPCSSLDELPLRRSIRPRRLAASAPLLVGATLIASACSDPPTRDCTAPTEISLIQLRGPEAEARMRSVCEDNPGGVRSGLFIEETNLREVDLPCLCAVTGFLLVQENPELTSLEGLGGVEELDAVILISDNPKLESLAGLPPTVTLGEYQGRSVEIARNHALRDLLGLPAFASAPGSISVFDNNGLLSLAGLPSELVEVGGLLILGNDQLSDLSALPAALTTIKGTFHLAMNGPHADAWELPRALVRVDGDLWLGGFNSFAGMPEGLSAVGGDLSLQLNFAGDLEGLGVIVEVGGNLMIAHNSALTELTGLADGLTLGGGVRVSDNDALVDLAGLPADLRVGVDEQSGTSLIVDDNASLASLAGLPASLTALPGGVQVWKNPALVDLSGLFDDLVVIGGGLSLIENAGIRDLSGMETLTALGTGLGGESLYLEGNEALQSLSGFPAGLTELPGSVAIVTSPELSDLTGLDAVESVGGDLLIGRGRASDLGDPCSWYGSPGGNAGLTSLKGLDALESVQGTLGIACNESLGEIGGLASLHTVGGAIRLIENRALADLTGLGGVGGALTDVGGHLQVFCSPGLELQAVFDVIAEVVGDVAIFVDLACP